MASEHGDVGVGPLRSTEGVTVYEYSLSKTLAIGAAVVLSIACCCALLVVVSGGEAMMLDAYLLLLIPVAVVCAILADVRQHDRWDAEDVADAEAAPLPPATPWADPGSHPEDDLRTAQILTGNKFTIPDRVLVGVPPVTLRVFEAYLYVNGCRVYRDQARNSIVVNLFPSISVDTRVEIAEAYERLCKLAAP